MKWENGASVGNNAESANRSLKTFAYGIIMLKAVPIFLGIVFLLSLAVRFGQLTGETAMLYMLIALVVSYFLIHKSAGRIYDTIRQDKGVADGR